MRPDDHTTALSSFKRSALLALLVAEPAWLNPGREHFGAPDHLWALTIDRYGDGQIGLLMSRPDALRQALVDTWHTWRRAWIEGEWR